MQQIIQDNISPFKKSLALQREKFKMGKDGSGENNFDLMCDALENIKSDIKHKCIKKGRSDIIKRVENIIIWYRSIEERHTKNTEDGVKLVLPGRMAEKINKNLTVGYELLLQEQDNLGLL